MHRVQPEQAEARASRPLCTPDKDFICRFMMTINLSSKRPTGAADNAAINMQMRQRRDKLVLDFYS